MDQLITAILLAGVLIFHIIVVSVREARYQRSIDRLTDKIMSRDYGEYKRNNHITIDDSKPQRKPISFYDDPSIEIDENEH